tara:strand:- start:288 stop:461 length:174 start_codon:yes stop_codon:yes gene_type:complete
MMIMRFVEWLELFIILNPFLTMFLFIVVGMAMERIYLVLNPDYTLKKHKPINKGDKK